MRPYWMRAELLSSMAPPHVSSPTINWLDDGQEFEALWRSHSGMPPPTRVVVTDGKMTADEAYGLACQGIALLWRGDFQEARQMLRALGNRADRAQRRSEERRVGKECRSRWSP